MVRPSNSVSKGYIAFLSKKPVIIWGALMFDSASGGKLFCAIDPVRTMNVILTLLKKLWFVTCGGFYPTDLIYVFLCIWTCYDWCPQKGRYSSWLTLYKGTKPIRFGKQTFVPRCLSPTHNKRKITLSHPCRTKGERMGWGLEKSK